MQRFPSLGAVFAAALLFAACASHPPKSKVGTGDAGRPRETAGYRIQAGDLLVITFSGEPDYNQQVRVDWDGRINLPYLAGSGRSEIPATGLTASELAERIGEYARGQEILLRARAQVVVAEYANQTFVVLGQVTLPGRYAFPRGVPPRLNLEDAIALGGGYTRLARQSLILVKHNDQITKVDLRRLSTKSGQPPCVIQPGDVITVPERIF